VVRLRREEDKMAIGYEYTDIPFDDVKYLSKIRTYLNGRNFHSKEFNQWEFFYDKDIRCIATIAKGRRYGEKSTVRILEHVPEFNKIKTDLISLVESE